MEDIITHIDDTERLKENMELYSQLGSGEKRALFERLKSIRSESAGLFLNRIYPLEKDKEIKKQIKKLLFRLKTMGVKVGELEIIGEPVLKKIEERREYKGFLSNYDPEGTRLVIGVFEIKRNNYLLVHAVTHLFRGLMEFTNALVERHNLEEIVKEYASTTKKPFVFREISAKYAAYLIEEASVHSQQYTDEAKQLKQFAAAIRSGVQKPEDIYTLPMPDIGKTMTLEEVLANDIFESFQLTWDTMENDKKEFDGVANGSSIILPPYMVEEKKEAFLKRLSGSSEMESKTEFVRRMLEDYAYLLYGMGEYSAYKGLIESARDPIGPKAVLLYFVKRRLEKTDQNQQGPEPGLIVNPYEQVRR